MESFSEQGQDLFAFDNCPTPGTFLDVGGWDPVKCNNSYALERAGWRGAVVEIDSRWRDQYNQTRKSPLIICDATKVKDWEQLCDDCNLPHKIDYLSLDVDDQPDNLKTFNILSDMLLDGLSFRAITLEHDAYRLGDLVRAPVRDLLEGFGYELTKPDVSCHPGDPAWTFEDWFTGAL